MYLKLMEKVEWRSWEKQGKASKYFCATVEILQNCNPPRKISECKKREGYIIVATSAYVIISF